jgi:hypothetical protein
LNKIWVKKTTSFKSSREIDLDYYLSMSPSKRLETVQFLREIIFRFKRGLSLEKSRKGLRRTIKIVQ